MTNSDHERTLAGPLSARFPSNFPLLWPDPNENNYWLYSSILCNKNGTKGLWGQKGQPSLGLGPALVFQWTLPWPYKTPDMALYKSAIFLHSMQRKWDQTNSFLLHRMQKYSHYIKVHVRCIVGPWQGPLKDQGGS